MRFSSEKAAEDAAYWQGQMRKAVGRDLKQRAELNEKQLQRFRSQERKALNWREWELQKWAKSVDLVLDPIVAPGDEDEKRAKASLSLQLTKMGSVALSKHDATIRVLAPPKAEAAEPVRFAPDAAPVIAPPPRR